MFKQIFLKIRYYTVTERSSVPFLLINAKCSLCGSSYMFKVNKKLEEKDSIDFFKVKRSKPHGNHDLKKQNMRGPNRTKVAEDVILKSNGSTKNYVESLRGAGVNDIPSQTVIRKVVKS